MSADSIAPPPPPAFKNRRGWIVAFGVIEILIGCLVLLMMALIVFANRLAPKATSTPQPDARLLIVTAIFYGVCAVFFVAVGIGNVQVKRWARLAMLGISWFWLAMGILGGLVMAVGYRAFMAGVQQNSTQQLPPHFATVFAIMIAVIFGVFFVLVPLVFVLFYSGTGVKASYESAAALAAPSRPPKPVPVLIATAWFALGVFGYLYVFVTPAFPLFGVVLRGWQAVGAVVLLEGCNVWLVVNIYRQRTLAWKLAFAMVLFGWVSMWVTMRQMGVDGMYRAMGYSEAQTAQIAPFMSSILVFSAGVAVVFLTFLLATRKHYRDAAAVS